MSPLLNAVVRTARVRGPVVGVTGVSSRSMSRGSQAVGGSTMALARAMRSVVGVVDMFRAGGVMTI